MKTTMKAFLMALSLGMAVSASAQEQNLFNGKDLSGWKGLDRLWSVKDGAIQGETLPDPENPKRGLLKHNSFLVWTGGEVEDFELRLKYRFVSNAGNSGIQFRSKHVEDGVDGPIVSGYQADCDAGNGYTGINYEERGRGILAKRGSKSVIKADAADANKAKIEVVGSVGEDAEIKAAIKPTGEWNDYLIIAKGNHIQQFINGKQTIDLVDEHEAKAAKKGILALQIHGGPPMAVQYKDIVLKSLK